MQAGAYQNGAYVVGVAKGGIEEGVDSLAQSVIIAPSGQIIAQSVTTADEVISAAIDLDFCDTYKKTLFDFDFYRMHEHYGLITERRGAITSRVADVPDVAALHRLCGVLRTRAEPGRYVCDRCGDAGTLDARYDYAAIGGVLTPESLTADPERSMWRYRPLLPLGSRTAVSALGVGWTPLIEAERLARRWGVGRLWIKDEGRQPTASLKDRASAVALARAAQEGAEIVTTASTGNAAAALAGLAAGTGQTAVIFVPETAPEAKVAQLLAYGAFVILVEGTYDDAFRLCQETVGRFGWYNRNTGINPYVGEGKKTVALEIAEQLGWEAPDAVFVSVGDGSIIGGVHKGFRDALELGWIDRMPRIYGVQAAGSSYLAEAWLTGEDVVTKPPVSADTAADSISADLPRDRVKAMAAVVDTGGCMGGSR